MKGFCLLLLPVILYAFCGVAAAQTCPVTFTIVDSWQGGFQAGISIENTGTAAINGWTLEWTFSGNQQISQLWGGNVTSQGETITVTNLSWDANIPVGGTMSSVGFIASGTTATPTALVLNGVACGSGGGGNPPADSDRADGHARQWPSHAFVECQYRRSQLRPGTIHHQWRSVYDGGYAHRNQLYRHECDE
jgi:hypothetical protein